MPWKLFFRRLNENCNNHFTIIVHDWLYELWNVVLAGDAEGVEALMDGLNGFVANGTTTDPMGNSAHWTHRREQEMQRTRRQGVFQKVMGMEAK
jgi:hypothetical protein